MGDVRAAELLPFQRRDLGERGAEVESKAHEASQLSAQVDAARQALMTSQRLEKVRAMQMQTQSRLAQRLVHAADGSYAPRLPDDQLRDRIAEADDTSARLLGVIESLSAEQPQYGPVLSTMVQAVLSARG